MADSTTITKNAKSNLAFTLIDMPEGKRQRMAQFYAFCRLVDDIVDEPGMTAEQRHTALDRWLGVIDGSLVPTEGIEAEVVDLIHSMKMELEPMQILIEGCRGDIAPTQPETREELLAYAYKVASCVGISSAAVMGASPAARDYAVALGYALQMVNIIRDVAEDCRKYDRFYLPKADMELFGVSKEDIREGRYGYRIRQLLAYEAALAEKFFAEAEEYYDLLSKDDRAALVPAQAMSLIYHTILMKMHDDEYRVFEHRYRVNNFKKLWFVVRARVGKIKLASLIKQVEWDFFKNNTEPKS
ncbi:MAG: phytoene/squalene synthase family protein [Akkermansia sp.]